MLKLFRLIALLEGVSYILLLFIGVPLKYTMNNPVLVKALGMPHGLLFVAYIALVILLQATFKWPTKTVVILLAASLIPFGTFYIDKKYLKPLA